MVEFHTARRAARRRRAGHAAAEVNHSTGVIG